MTSNAPIIATTTIIIARSLCLIVKITLFAAAAVIIIVVVNIFIVVVVAAADISQLHLLHSLFIAIYARFLVVQLNRFALGWGSTTTNRYTMPLCHRTTLRPLHSAAAARDCSSMCAVS